MKKFAVICAFIAALPAMSGYCSGEETAGNGPTGAPCKEMHEGRGPAEGMQRGRFAVIAKVLRLTDAQLGKIEDILKAECNENAAIVKKMTENRKSLREKSHNGTFDEAGLRTLAEQQGQLVARMIISQAVVRNKIRALMTSEQRDMDDRIQPLLEQGPENRPQFCGVELPLFMGMAPRPHFPDKEFPPNMKRVPGDPTPCCEDDGVW